MLGVVKQVKEGYKKLRRQEEEQIDQEVEKIRAKIVKGCLERMEHGIFEASFKCVILPRNRPDLQERCRKKLEHELRQSEFKDTDVHMNDGTSAADNDKPSVIMTLSWRHFEDSDDDSKKRPRGTVGNVIETCPICISEKAMCAFTPCGHMCCADCHTELKCPYCRAPVTSLLPLFHPGETHESKNKRARREK